MNVRRRYPDSPLVGAAAAVFDGQGRVLLVQRARPPLLGQWGLPGGMLELGEQLAAAAAREVQEECGIAVAIGGVAGVFEPITYDEQGRIEYHYVVIDFWARHVAGEAVAGDDAAALAWVEIGDIERYALLPESRQVVLDAHRLWQNGQQNGQQQHGTD